MFSDVDEKKKVKTKTKTKTKKKLFSLSLSQHRPLSLSSLSMLEVPAARSAALASLPGQRRRRQRQDQALFLLSLLPCPRESHLSPALSLPLFFKVLDLPPLLTQHGRKNQQHSVFFLSCVTKQLPSLSLFFLFLFFSLPNSSRFL